MSSTCKPYRLSYSYFFVPFEIVHRVDERILRSRSLMMLSSTSKKTPVEYTRFALKAIQAVLNNHLRNALSA